jgi:S-(hydroxymethyl)glutathione dehydrogenase/alcohol dehydrogenase
LNSHAKTKAAILVELNRPLVVADIVMPDELAFGQVLVKVHYSGICGAQINEIDGAKGPDRFLPHLLGHEGSATVLDVGIGVKTVAKGDTVVMHWRPSDGLQSDPPCYEWDGRRVNAGWVTTFNQRAIVSENRLTRLPQGFDLRVAPLFGCAVTTAMGVVNRDAALQVGQSVVVFGVGGVGVNIVQAAQMVSAYPIVAVDIVVSKLEWAKRFGASHAFDSNDPGLADRIREVVGALGADVVVDTTGRARVIELAYDLTRPDGKTILVGVPRKGDNISIYSLPLHFRKVLTGSHGGSAEPHVDIPRLVRLLAAGRMTLDGLITHEFPLDAVNDAITLVRRGEAGRVVLRMD